MLGQQWKYQISTLLRSQMVWGTKTGGSPNNLRMGINLARIRGDSFHLIPHHLISGLITNCLFEIEIVDRLILVLTKQRVPFDRY